MVKKIAALLIPAIISLVFGVIVYAEEDIQQCCGTNREVINELHNGLINNVISNSSNDINLMSIMPGKTDGVGLMPSTGNVKMLVLPIEFFRRR